MRSHALALLLLPALAYLASCGGADPDPAGAREPAVVKAADGSLRVPFLGGAFVTHNREMPADMAQAVAGEPTDHPVVVMAAY